MVAIHETDKRYLLLIRENVDSFIQKCAILYDKTDTKLLDIAPQDYEGAKKYFKKAKIFTMDIAPGEDYTLDITENNSEFIDDETFDYVLCTEVLEHVLQPFKAVEEIRRIVKRGGLVFVSTPFNFRIHGPLPDCWRFTEHGLKALFKDFEIVSLDAMQSDRFLMPIHYTLICTK